jgi:RNA polymerase sigma factor (sigma-70 family)
VPATVSVDAAHRAIEATYRVEAPRLIGGLTRILRDVGLAEELAQDALLIALDQWPQTGVPRNPGAWLMTTAKRRALDYFRRNKMAARKLDELAYDLEAGTDEPDPDAALDDEVGDDLLSLIFTACHPALSPEARAALTLRLVGGLTTDEIARAFLVPEATMAQRIVRAKRTLAEAGLPFAVPRGKDREARLASVLEVIYLSSTKAIQPPSVTTGCAANSARKRCASAARWPGSRPPSRKCMASSPCSKSRPRASAPVSVPMARRYCSWIRIARAGTSY